MEPRWLGEAAAERALESRHAGAVLPLECRWTDVTNRRVTASLVVEHLDVVEHSILASPHLSKRSVSSVFTVE